MRLAVVCRRLRSRTVSERLANQGVCFDGSQYLSKRFMAEKKWLLRLGPQVSLARCLPFQLRKLRLENIDLNLRGKRP